MKLAARGARGATPYKDTNRFPRLHLLLAILLAAAGVAGISSSLQSADDESGRALLLPLTAEPATIEPITISAVPLAVPVINRKDSWQRHTVRSGDSLSVVFQRAGLNDGDVGEFVALSPNGKELTKIYPGQTLAFEIDDSGRLTALDHVKSRLLTVSYERSGKIFTMQELVIEPERQQTYVTATIGSSLFMAGQNAGLSQNTIMELANIFGGVIDFVLDPRKGDTIHVLYEELYIKGEKYGDGNILAAEFVNRGTSHTAFRYVDANDQAGYFSEDGVSMRKAFLLAPVDFTRISSNFNLRRLHPIYKTTRPHRGTDYAAPRGTPVFAAGDGRVSKAGYSKANGNYVVIQHGEQYVTKYLHLHKRKVKTGSRVSQQQVIGTVGSTGAATGPHLHYEFLLNGVHRNPRTIHKKLPKAKSLASQELPRFKTQIQPFTRQLASMRQQHLITAQSTATATAAL